MITAVLGVLGALTAWFTVVFVGDVAKNKNALEPESNFIVSGVIGFIVNFFDTLGIGSFAPLTFALRTFKQVQDRVLPGTLNVSCTFPVVAEAFIFITAIDVEPVTLIGMLAAATIGAWIGAGIVSKLPEKKVQMLMAVALLITGILMLLSKFNLMPSGGEAIGLSGVKLCIGIVANFVLGALMTAGIGLYAPCMALVYILGMSPRVAFPIMMGSCAFLMPVASVKFVKEQAYSKKASLAIGIFGMVGVFIAAKLVKELPLTILSWLVIVVILYTSFTLFKSALKEKESV